MPRIERSITINAPVGKVFEYHCDPANQPAWLPGMVQVSDVHRTEGGVGSTFRWVYKMAGVRFEGESKTTEYVPNQRTTVETTGGIPSVWTWAFEPYGEGTKMTLGVEYTVPIPILGRLAEALVLRQNEREAELGLSNVKSILEG